MSYQYKVLTRGAGQEVASENPDMSEFSHLVETIRERICASTLFDADKMLMVACIDYLATDPASKESLEMIFYASSSFGGTFNYMNMPMFYEIVMEYLFNNPPPMGMESYHMDISSKLEAIMNPHAALCV